MQLTFDRAIDISALNASAILVNDASVYAQQFQGVGGTLVSPESVLITLTSIGSATGSGASLTADDTTHIVAVDDGGAWGGVPWTYLPFP